MTGRVALISGGSGYLGGALAEGLAEAGASVIVSSREKSRAITVAESLPSPTGAMLLLACDAGSYITGQNILVDGGWTAW